MALSAHHVRMVEEGDTRALQTVEPIIFFIAEQALIEPGFTPENISGEREIAADQCVTRDPTHTP